ncbi:type II secretion system minor pseudopilin GspH [Parathalassolituus penaei]|uniref:Type II secretion system protein H n=1 Tax=Parathalassolituus penaei TaxID=2997323 RepID=A0A9X3ISQ5_9GAMM|nr:type II secretion system minor pseudopilin GspH [Parathalassolituus penaei]MCY0965495.1 type II secretion system minor pseudopilin GspH [Parathalassolituus penaei]
MTGIHKHSESRGFTLLEVMVVLFVIGLITSLVTFNSSDRKAQDDTQKFGKQLAVVMNLYRDEAVYRNLDLGLAMDVNELLLLAFQDVRRLEVSTGKSSDELQKLADNPWQPYASETLKAPAVPEGMALMLTLDGKEVDFEDLLDDDDKPLPALEFLSADEYTPFELTLEHSSDTSFAILLHGDGFNPVWSELVRYED